MASPLSLHWLATRTVERERAALEQLSPNQLSMQSIRALYLALLSPGAAESDIAGLEIRA